MKAGLFFTAFTISGCLVYLSIGCNSSKNDELAEGEQLANKVCASCHAFPDPSLLDKNTWLSNTLPKMADFIHVEGLNDPYTVSELEKDKLPATREMQAPGLTLKEWNKILKWYGTLAPLKPLERIVKPADIKTSLKLFTPMPLLKEEYPVTTLVKIDSLNHGFFLGDGSTQIVYHFNKKMQVADSFIVPVGVTDFNKRQNGFETITMGSLRPPDSKLGKLGKTTGGMNFHVILDSLERPVHALYHDLNQDGREDIIISEFGFRVGYLSWYENKGEDQYEKHILKELPGAVRTEVYDFNKDGLP
ncbi:MAG TPA: VCBS repeat-containing protein, partial [Chitinophagaceae bacterium]|nr:VCBS repeat-containing protein [Chitinophagaceae bacterium]